MKGLFMNCMSYKTPADLEVSGVYKKVRSQISALGKYFNMEHFLGNITESFDFTTLRDRILVKLPFNASIYKWKFKEDFLKYDFIYFRRAYTDSTVIKLFKAIKKRKPDMKILFEVHTYPYDDGWSFKEFPYKIKDEWNRKKLKKYVDRIVVVGEGYDKIFNVPVINIKNGIDFNTIPCNPINTTNDINMISVSSYNERHGWDRIIEGMIDYYKNNGKREMTLHLVGPGVPASLINKVNNSIIKDRVIFYGSKGGKDLDEIFAKCNFAVDSLALHRMNLEFCSSLKSREYSARGLPFISCSLMDYLPIEKGYYLKVDSNEKPINIKQMIEFFDNIYKKNDIESEIRKFALSTCDMSITMKPVIDYLLENGN